MTRTKRPVVLAGVIALIYLSFLKFYSIVADRAVFNIQQQSLLQINGSGSSGSSGRNSNGSDGDGYGGDDSSGDGSSGYCGRMTTGQSRVDNDESIRGGQNHGNSFQERLENLQQEVGQMQYILNNDIQSTVSANNGVVETALPLQLENATFVTLARNTDLLGLMNTIRSVEDRFNGRYHYDWVFLNNEPFNAEFINITSNLVSGTAKYGIIGINHWSYPEWINRTIAAEVRTKMKHANIIYGDSESYRHMCRYESGFFHHHPLMQEYRYYWRVEPETLLHCDITYDVFKLMREEKKKYGFTISLREFSSTIETLWLATRQYLDKFPEAFNQNGLLDFISDDKGVSYNLCHFWSNFEIGDMEFWRSETYQNYFDFLDHAGGFYYERWGDAPIHSIAASLFLDKSEIHFFDDIGYTHPPFTHCPLNPIDRGLTCSCLPTQNFDWQPYSCTKQYYSAQNLDLPDGIQ